MNFKIEINYLNIDNYPSVERHFEEMASKGWLIQNVFIGALFLYKKVEPLDLDFSITPYEMETFLTRRSKADLEEFQGVTRDVGWEFATKSYDLHIYYKPTDSDAIPLQTDEEEEFYAIEHIAKRYLKAQYILLPLLLVLSWLFFRNLFLDVDAMKDGYAQIISLALPFTTLMSVLHIIDLRRFLKKNRANIEQGDSLEFNNNRRGIYQVLYKIFTLIFLGAVLYTLYTVFVLKNTYILVGLLPVLAGFGVGFAFRMFFKPIKSGVGFKLIGLIVMGILAGVLGIFTGFIDLDFLEEKNDMAVKSEYRVLSFDYLPTSHEEEQGSLTRNASLLIPESYNYASFSRNDHLTTEYSAALNDSLAKNLVKRYFRQAEERNRQHFIGTLELALYRGGYSSYLTNAGLTEEEFYQLAEGVTDENIEDKLDEGMEIIYSHAITEANDVWNQDEAYYLTHEKDEIVLRKGNEVFYLWGFDEFVEMDFSQPEIIAHVKERLALD